MEGGFTDILKQAADIKTAQLKARPGRQEWETSPDWIKYTAWSGEDVQRLRSAPWQDRLQAATALKDEGNALFEEVWCAPNWHLADQPASASAWL